jgi:CMP-N,N'-diacetyllegionaminic acid synthase
MNVLAIIPARGGSKGIARKNLRLLGEKPLIAYAIDAAQGSSLIGAIAVTTDDPEIAQVAHEQGCTVIDRPSTLAQDATPMVPVILHALEEWTKAGAEQPEITVLLQPTAPLRTARHIDEAVQLLIDDDAGSVVSVCPVPGHFSPDWQLAISNTGELEMHGGGMLSTIPTRRQDLRPTYYRNGAVYAFKTAPFIEDQSLYIAPCKAYRMAPPESVNIDSEADFWVAEG